MDNRRLNRDFTLSLLTLPVALLAILMFSCRNSAPEKPPEIVVVAVPEKIDEKVAELLHNTVNYLNSTNGTLNDSVKLPTGALNIVYNANGFRPLWSTDERWTPSADSMYDCIRQSAHAGLFPSDYHLSALAAIRGGMLADSLHKKNAAQWARADVLLTAAYLDMAHDLYIGRLPKDSISLRSDSLYTDSTFARNLQQAVTDNHIKSSLEQLEPVLNGYRALKAALPQFLDSVKFTATTFIDFPSPDSIGMMKQVGKRLAELGFVLPAGDSTPGKAMIRRYQKEAGLPVTGMVAEKTAASLNNTPWNNFKRIAVTLDRYKRLPDTLPSQYLWVNLPGFYLQLWNNDTMVLSSKIVVGKPQTRTPVLTSKISNIVTYPQWTIPESIIVKEVLPGLKKDTNYLRKKGYSLINFHGDEVYPSTVKWAKYNKGIPYKVVQGSGDDNALGILKFNFSNKYAVYLHDTNQRYFFDRSYRALSHGCVRVQQWNKLARFLISNDSLAAAPASPAFKTDTLSAWLQRKEKHTVPVKTRLPLFIRYFGCDGINGKVVFYPDIYGEDALLADRYFADKPLPHE